MNLTPQQIEAVNRRVHEVTHPGECWHRDLTVDSSDEGTSMYRCGVCGEICDPGPDYWHDANACLAALDTFLEYIEIEKFNGPPMSYHVNLFSVDKLAFGCGDTITQAGCDAILDTVGESVESVIAKAGKS